jgi:para-nitrobenzyl esterase
VAEHFLETLGIAPADAAVALRDVPPDKLLDTQQQTVLKLGTRLGLLAFQPLVDGTSLPESPLEAVRTGHAGGIDLLTGTTRDEWKLFGFLDAGLASLDDAGLLARLEPQVRDAATARNIVETYRGARSGKSPAEPRDLFFAIETDRVFRIPALRLADAHQAHHANVFLYQFTWESPLMGGALGACHAIELPFVFGIVGRKGAEGFAGEGPDAERLAANMMDAWIAFARTGDPSHPGLPGGRWEPYDARKRATMVMGRECAIDHDVAGAEREAWEGLI